MHLLAVPLKGTASPVTLKSLMKVKLIECAMHTGLRQYVEQASGFRVDDLARALQIGRRAVDNQLVPLKLLVGRGAIGIANTTTSGTNLGCRLRFACSGLVGRGASCR
ncbi:MAG: hypothetical protein GY724_02020 [Actinomycetia bacterium]|nr:hypothetical protein [Actinomycetes bacterium]